MCKLSINLEVVPVGTVCNITYLQTGGKRQTCVWENYVISPSLCGNFSYTFILSRYSKQGFARETCHGFSERNLNFKSEYFLLFRKSGPNLVPTQHPISQVPGFFCKKYIARGERLSNYIRVNLKLRMRGGVPVLPL
jgi:hypothetical protein